MWFLNGLQIHEQQSPGWNIRTNKNSNALGRYERGEAVPSVEVSAKIASELGASLDYLLGISEIGIDSYLMSRYKEINTLSDNDRRQLYAVIDALLRDYKSKKAYSK